MQTPAVPEERVLFDIAVGTRDGCQRVYGGNPEDVITPLAVAAFQLQAAWVGARMAAMANHPEYTPALEAVATDYGGVSVAALNLSVRCSVTAVDHCGEALARLTGLSTEDTWLSTWFDARKVQRKCRPVALTDQRLAPLATAYLARVSDQQWRDTEELRHEATHRGYRRGIYGTTRQPPAPRPLADPQQLDIDHKSWGKQPLDQLTERVTCYAETTFRELCEGLTALV
jgi:hypothetical protein